MRHILLSLLLAAIIGCEQPTIVQPQPQPVAQRQVIAFTATWCGPCHAQRPILDRIQATGITLHRIDVDQQRELAQRYGITAVPTYFLFEGRRLVLRTNSAQEVLDRL